MAFRRDKNIGDSLVRTNLQSSDSPGTLPCHHALCHTCSHVNPITSITNRNKTFTIKATLTCSSSSVIYCISCTQCNILYIGETSRQINNRFGEHMRNVRNKTHLNEQHENDPDSNISRHFNSPNHSTDDMMILGLLFAPTDSTKRKTLEKRIIFKLGTLFPAGLNKQFNYLQWHYSYLPLLFLFPLFCIAFLSIYVTSIPFYSILSFESTLLLSHVLLILLHLIMGFSPKRRTKQSSVRSTISYT